MNQVISNQESYRSLLFITGKGKLARIYCPFRVFCIIPVDNIPERSIVYVDAVVYHSEYVIAYLIMGNYYPYYCFYLPINY